MLVCGCGHGAELQLYQKLYPLAHITGVDPNPAAAKGFAQSRVARLMCMTASEIGARLPKGLFNKVRLRAAKPADARRIVLVACALTLASNAITSVHLGRDHIFPTPTTTYVRQAAHKCV